MSWKPNPVRVESPSFLEQSRDTFTHLFPFLHTEATCAIHCLIPLPASMPQTHSMDNQTPAPQPGRSARISHAERRDDEGVCSEYLKMCCVTFLGGGTTLGVSQPLCKGVLLKGLGHWVSGFR